MLQRLVRRLQDATRRREVSAVDWPTAMVAYALHMSEEPELLHEGLTVYADFAQCVDATARRHSLARLADFVQQRRGSGWRALLLYAMGEQTQPELSERAASLAIMSAAPSAADASPLSGARSIVELLAREDAPASMLGGLLSLPDLRFLPMLSPLFDLPRPRRQALLAGVTCTLNSLSSAFVLQMLEADPTLASEATAALLRMAGKTPLVADVALPIPTWAYKSPTPQPLHAWSLAEFLPRMLPRLEPHLSPQQIESLRVAFA